MNIDVNPNTAFVTCPLAVAMSAGSAKNARYVSELPSRSSSFGMGSGRTQRAVDHSLGDGPHLRSFAHRPALDERERVLLGHLDLVHEDALGPLDRLAGFEL